MRLLGTLRFHLRALFRRHRLDREMEAEMNTHLDALTQANIAAGMSPEEARLTARRRFGGVDQIRERALDARGGRWLEEIFREVRHAARALRRNPAYATVAIVSLALAVGANTAVFSLVNGIILRSLPVPHPEQLRMVQWVLTTNQSGSTIRGVTIKPAVFVSLQNAVQPAGELFGYLPVTSVNARAGTTAFSTQGLAVSGNAMPTLGTRPLLGRVVANEDDRAGAEPVVTIGYGMWKRQFGGTLDVLGHTLLLNEAAFTIVGVMPKGFHGVDNGDSSEFFLSLEAAARIEPALAIGPRTRWPLELMARLRPGTPDAALSTTIESTIRTAEPTQPNDARRLLIREGRGGSDWSRSYYRESLTMLSAAVGFLMLVACANLAGLSVVRTIARTREHAVRAALGAGRTRLLRGALIENLLLATAGAGLGVVLTLACHSRLSRLVAGTEEGLHFDTSIDGRVFAFTIGLTVLTAVLSGLLPGWRAARVDPNRGLKSGGVSGARGSIAIRALVALQVAASIVLMAGTGLYVRTLRNLLEIDPGIPVEHRVIFRLKSRETTPAAIMGFHERVITSIRNVPGISAATTLNMKPLLGLRPSSASLLVPTATGSDSVRVPRYLVGDAFFETMQIPLIAGRTFAQGERRAAVVNESFAETLGGPVAALGLVLRSSPDPKSEWQVVGICRDTRLITVKEPAIPAVFLPLRDAPSASIYYIIEGTIAPEMLIESLRRAVVQIDPEVALAGIATQTDIRAKNLRRENLVATLVTALAAIALFLCCIGLYGVIAFAVARRTPEFGVRLALGATARDIVLPILRESLVLASLGAVAGLAAALACGQYLASQLYGVTPRDPLTLAGVTILLLLLSVMSAWLPARRASRVNPMVALRAE